MSVAYCANCSRLISISAIPDGNPVAINDHEGFSLTYRGCGSCGRIFCDRCAPSDLTICPRCREVMDPPPREGPYVYKKPTERGAWVKPGPGLTDLMDLPVEPVESFLEAVERMVESASKYTKPYPYPLMDLNIIYRMLGSPRAWQLGGEQVLRQLAPPSLAAVREWAAAALDETDVNGSKSLKPGERYLYCPEPPVRFKGDMPELDFCNVELVEKLFWLVTMPVEFVESVARLTDVEI